jgi:hydrogenase expression/formation protein HypC
MCLGIPMQVIECNGYVALCQGRGGVRQLDLALVGEQPVGAWLLTFIDAAREVIDAERAAQINAALDGLEAVMAGETDISRHFADLFERTPELPAHLRGVTA